MTNKFNTTFGVALLLLMTVACNSKNSIEPVNDESSPFARESKSQNLRFNVSARTSDANNIDTVEFEPGQLIYFTMTVTNITGEPQTISQPDGGYPAFCIRRAGTDSCLWDSRFNKVFTQAVVPVDFTAFESRDFAVVVEQLDNTGGMFGSGEYEIRGLAGYDLVDFLGSMWHSFSVTE